MSDTAPSSEFTPERAQRYVAEALPPLLARAAANLGLEDSEGHTYPEPNARAARVSLLSAAEVLRELGPLAGDDLIVPLRAALGRLEGLFKERHPELPLEMPKRAPATSLEAFVAHAWEDAAAGAEPEPAPVAGTPGPGLPARGSALDLPD